MPQLQNMINNNRQIQNSHNFFTKFENSSITNFTQTETAFLNKCIKYYNKPQFTNKVKEILGSVSKVILRLNSITNKKVKIADLI